MVTRADHLARLESRFDYADYHLGRADELIELAYLWLFNGDDSVALNYSIQSTAHLVAVMEYLMDKNYPWGQEYSIVNFLDLKTAGGEEYELTMEKLLATMMTADSDDVWVFMGTLDAYKHAIWDVPYDQQFFANLSRMFKP